MQAVACRGNLELGQIDVERAVEAKRGGDRADDLRNEAIQIRVCRPWHIKRDPTNVVNSLVVDHKAAVAVLEGRVRREDAVVGLDDRRRDLKSPRSVFVASSPILRASGAG